MQYSEMHFGKFQYNGLYYYLQDDTINHLVLPTIIGNVECVPISPVLKPSFVQCCIKQNHLTVTGLSACIRSNDLMQALATGFQPDHQESIPYSIFTEPVFTDLIVLTYDELDIPIDFSGKLGANQIFVDEIRYPNAITHKEVSTFIFGNGTLDLEISTIQQSKEKVISMRTWNDEIPKLLDEQPSAQINSCRTFFVNPTGDMRQNDYLVDVVVNYLATGRISSATLEHVISYEKPVLKTHLKVETEPGSCQFVDRTFDLVQEARKQGDLPLLEKLLRYQQAEE